MSLERRERRRCDLCEEVISDAEYYECIKKYTSKADTYTPVNDNVLSGIVTGFSSISVQCNPARIDVCKNCWDKMTR